MAKQTFTTGQVLTAAQMTSLQETAMGGGPATAKVASYVLVAADAGTTVAMNAAGATTITVNTGLFAAGDTVFIQNLGAGACTVTAGTATVATAGSLILPQNDAGILYFTSASAAIFYDYIQVGAASPLTTKGDLYTFGTSDTRLGVGADGTTLVADSSTATGLKYQAATVNTVIDAKGDLLAGTAADTIARIAVGANDTVLTADSSTATGLKWATSAAGGMTLISTTTLTGTTITLSSIPQTYNSLYLVFKNVDPVNDTNYVTLRLNGTSSVSYYNFITFGSQSSSAADTRWVITNGIDVTVNANLATITIPDYTNATTRKMGFINYVGSPDTGSADISSLIAVGGSTITAAVSSLTITTNSGDFSSGTVLLYGVK
jgi:hypothetical protein